MQPRSRDVPAMIAAAEAMDTHAEFAELMGDADGAAHWRERAQAMRLRAMTALDD